MRRGSVAVLLTLALSAPAFAQQPAQKKTITLKDMLAQPTYGGYQISPDGKHVLFSRTDREPKEWAATSHIWLHDLTTGKSWQLTNSQRGESNARWLDDGSALRLHGRVCFAVGGRARNQTRA